MRNILAELLSASEAEWPSLLSEASVIFSSIVATSPSGNGNASITPDTTQEQLTSSGTAQDNDGRLGSSPLQRSDLSDGPTGHTSAAPDDSDGRNRGHDGGGAADDRDEERGRHADALGVQRAGRAPGRQAQRVDGPNPLE